MDTPALNHRLVESSALCCSGVFWSDGAVELNVSCLLRSEAAMLDFELASFPTFGAFQFISLTWNSEGLTFVHKCNVTFKTEVLESFSLRLSVWFFLVKR